MRLLWITNIHSPYRLNVPNRLAKACELSFHFEHMHISALPVRQRGEGRKDAN